MEFNVYSRRWKHFDKYTIERTTNRWRISHIVIGGECNKRGEPYLFDNFNQDSINYPEELRGYMEYLWKRSKGKSDKWIQPKLNTLAKWVSKVESKSPKKGIWDSFK